MVKMEEILVKMEKVEKMEKILAIVEKIIVIIQGLVSSVSHSRCKEQQQTLSIPDCIWRHNKAAIIDINHIIQNATKIKL